MTRTKPEDSYARRVRNLWAIAAAALVSLAGCTRVDVFSHCQETRELVVGQTVRRPPKGTTRVTVLKIDQPGNRALLKIEGPQEVEEGWIHAGNYAAFRQTGPQGMRLLKLEAKTVSVEFYWGDHYRAWKLFYH